MLILRSSLFLLLQLLITPPYAFFALLTAPLPRLTRYRLITAWSRLMVWLLRWVCGLRYRVEGQQNLPAAPYIILAKHQSAWETLAFAAIFPPVSFVLKKELLRLPFFGWGLALTSPIAIDRSAGREALKQLLSQGAERVQQGFCVVVFPEGTRVKPGEKGKYNIGGAWLASHTRLPVVPVAHNAGRLWGKNGFLKRPGTITVSIGQPIDSHNVKPGELNQQVESWIEAEMARLDPAA